MGERELGLCWALTVFGGYAVARWGRLGPAGPWITATAYGVLLGIYMLVRFRRGGWRGIRLDHLEEQREADRVRGFDAVRVAQAVPRRAEMPPLSS